MQQKELARQCRLELEPGSCSAHGQVLSKAFLTSAIGMLGQKFLYMIHCHYEGGCQVRPLSPGSTERQTRVSSVLIRAPRGLRQHLRHPPPAQTHKAGGKRARYIRRVSHRTHPDTSVNRPYLTLTEADSDALWSSVITGPRRFISSTAWPIQTLLSCSKLSI